jgi:hypothetical protein
MKRKGEMTMKLPEQIRVNGVDFAVEMRNDLNDGEKVLYGDVHYGYSRIRLNPMNQQHQRMCVTLWHEIFHIFCETNNIELGDDEEKIIDTFAFGVYQVLQDNGGKLFDLRGGDG